MVWELCMDSDGTFIRNPNEILNEWTYEQVLDALELSNIRQRAIATMKARARTRKGG